MAEKESNEIDMTLNEKYDAAVNVELADLTRQLGSAEQHYTDMRKKLEDQALILHKTELAYESQTELLNAKSEIIENLKTFLEHQKNDSVSNKQTLRSEVETVGQLGNDELTPPIPGLQESVLCLRNTALHGVILSGLLVWVNMQRRTTAENIWKAIATKHFTKDEITDAKEALWDVGDSYALGKQIKRQGPSKSSSELDDISTALTILAEKKIIPLFITTSNMLMRTPSYNLNTHDADNDAVVNRLKLLEDSVNAFIGNQCDHNKELFNKYETLVVSRTAETTKLDEIIKKRNNYITLLDERLRTLEVPDEVDRCRNVNCGSKCHIEKIDEFLICILNTIKTTANDCLPCNKKKKGGNSKKTPIAFWRDEVQPYKDKSMFWHSVWISAGRPINTELHRIMKRSRNAYHFQIRKNKKLAENLKKNAFLNACINNNEDIFKLIRKERATTPSVPTTMDGVSTDIENHFASIYKTLYNSVDVENDLSNYKEHLSKKINPSSIVDAWRITPERVHDAVQCLKNEKNDPVIDFKSDCLKNAPPIFCTQLSLLFRQFLIHGHISSFLMISTLIPLVKEKMGDITSSDNYRSISISSLILKVFDYVILDIHGDSLTVDELQFGYQDKISTSMCTWLVVETIEYFQRHGSNVCLCDGHDKSF